MSTVSIKGLAASRLLSAAFKGQEPQSIDSVRKELEAKKAFSKNSDAAVVKLSGSTFRNDLEKHIDDYRKGKGNLSKKIGNRVQARHAKTGSDLNTVSPTAAKAYAGYSTSFNYASASRFKASMFDATANIKTVKEAYAKEDEYREYYESLFAQKTKSVES